MLSLLLACTQAAPDTGAPVQDTQTDAPLITLYRDADRDGFGDPDWTRGSDVDALDGWTQDATDCNDADPSTFPGAPEVSADGVDQDCDGRDPCTHPRRWHHGDVALASADQWEAFCTDHDAVDGDLSVTADAPADWIGCLCEVSGSVDVDAPAYIAALRGVTAIGGDLETSHTSDLRSLQTAGAVFLWAERIDLPRLRTVEGDAAFQGRNGTPALEVPLLQTVGGELYFREVTGALPALTHAGPVSAYQATVSLPHVTYTESVRLSWNTTLDMAALTSTGEVTYASTEAELIAPALWSVDTLMTPHAPAGGLPSLTRAGLIVGKSLPSLPALVHLDAVYWQGSADDLVSAAPALRRIEDATFRGTIDLDRVPTPWRIDTLTFTSSRLRGELTDPSVIDGTLILSEHDESSLAPLGNVTTIPGGLRILNSRTLETLELDGLEHIGGGLLIVGNTGLPPSEIDALLDQVTVAGNVVVE